MADNVPITAGAGTDVATDDVAGVHYQKIKVALGLADAVDTLLDSGQQTMANSVPVVLASDQTAIPDKVVTAQSLDMSSTANSVSVTDVNSCAGASFQITGTWTGTVIFEGTIDGTNWFTINVLPINNTTGIIVTIATANGQWHGHIPNFSAVRVRCAVTGTGTAVVTIRTGTGLGAIAIDQSAPVVGDVAHDGVNISTSNPVLMGLDAIAHGTNPTAVAASDRTKWYANRAGIPFVMGGHPNVQTVRLQFTAAQTNTAIITVSAGTKIVVTALQVTLDNASTVFPSVLIGFGTATTPTTTGVIAAHGGVPAGGGFSRGDGSGIIGIGADDEDLRITTVGTATGNGVEVIVTYYTIES